MKSFEQWWDEKGSGITPEPGHDMEAHAKRISAFAWAEMSPQKDSKDCHFTEIDLGALDADTFSGSEALWMLKALAHAIALAMAYKEIMPDAKARKAWEVIVAMQEDRIRAAYPGAEAYLVLHKAKSAARKGVDAQKQKMREVYNAAKNASRACTILPE